MATAKTMAMDAELRAPEVKRRSMTRENLLSLLRNKTAMVGLVVIVIIALLCIFANFTAPYGYDEQNPAYRNLSPNSQFIFGTDNLGRDIFSRILYGGRLSLLIGFVATGVAGFFGIMLGAISGYFGGIVDAVIMRIMDVMMALPNILLAICICAVLGGGMMNVMIAVGVSMIPMFARVARGPILAVQEMEYVEAARAINARTGRIILRHVMPTVLSPMIVQVTMSVSVSIIAGASLSYLALGAQPPIPEWGLMLSNATASILRYPWQVIFPALLIGIVVLSMNLVGDGLRDALDPRLKD
jgi:peptide/nickel transport system permease protein